MKRLTIDLLFSLVFLWAVLLPMSGLSQSTDADQIHALESRVSHLEYGIADRADTGGVVCLFGAFCALWAQNTRRNPWLWFFVGVLFSVIAVLVLLKKNADDKNSWR